MKKQYSIVKSMMILCIVLCLFETLLLIIEFDLKHIILSCICYVGLVAIIIVFLIYKKETSKIIFEFNDDNISSRLITYDDYQIVRTLLNKTPLTNTLEEANLLKEYEELTIDMVRIQYHYLIFIENEAIALMFTKVLKEKVVIEFKKIKSDEEKIKNKLILLAKEHDKIVEFK